MPLIEEAHKAARILLDQAYVRIVARGSPDAVCAAALLAHALRREGVDFHASWTRRLDDPARAALAQEAPDCLLLIGLSGDAAAGPLPGARRVVLDAVATGAEADASVHDEASLASLAFLVAAGVSRRNGDLAPLAVAGALSAYRHAGGLTGLDAEVLAEALEARVMLREPALALQGQTLTQALTQIDAPFIAGVTGRARNVKKLVADLDLPGDQPPGVLRADDAERLGSFLTFRLLQQSAPDAALDALFRPSLRALQGPHTGSECGELARIAETACAAGRPGLGFAALWPDPSAAGEAADVVSTVRDELIAALLRAERDARHEGRLVIAEAPRASLCRPLVDRLALMGLPPEHVAVVHAPDPHGAFLTLRSYGPDAGDIARKAAAICGGVASGGAREAQLFASEPTLALKALAEALA